jgi:hypothetical protein
LITEEKDCPSRFWRRSTTYASISIDFLERAIRDALITRRLLVERNQLAAGS